MNKRKEFQDENSQNKLKKLKENDLEIYFDQNIYPAKNEKEEKKLKSKGIAGKGLILKLKENFNQNCKIIEKNNSIPNTIFFKLNQKFLKQIIYIQPSSENFIINNHTMISYFNNIKEQIEKYFEKEQVVEEEEENLKFFLILESFTKTYNRITTEIYKKMSENKTYRPGFNPKKCHEIITELQIDLDINTRETQNSDETSDFLITFIMNLLKKENEITSLDFKISKISSIKDSKEFLKSFLLELSIPEIKVNGILKKYNSIKLLSNEYYFSNKTENEKINLLTNLECIYPAGQNRMIEEKKKIGKAISQKVYNHFKEEDDNDVDVDLE